MSTENDREAPVSEPAGSILAEVGKRRSKVGRLAAATGISGKTLQRRLVDPNQFRLGELAQIATALDVPTRRLVDPWCDEVDRREAEIRASAAASDNEVQCHPWRPSTAGTCPAGCRTRKTACPCGTS